MQMVHLAASVASEWRCRISANAEQTVSRRHNHAIALENDRKRVTPLIDKLLYNGPLACAMTSPVAALISVWL